jgi:hypothetical protein
MSTTPSTVASKSGTKTQAQTIGLYVEMAGGGALLVGAVLSAHHTAIGICILAGAAAVFVGRKLRA